MPSHNPRPSADDVVLARSRKSQNRGTLKQAVDAQQILSGITEKAANDARCDMADLLARLLAQPAQEKPSAMVIADCIDAILVKLSCEPAWRIAGSGFLERVLPAIVDASTDQLKAVSARRHALLDETEHLRDKVRLQENELKELREKRNNINAATGHWQGQEENGECALLVASEEVERLETHLRSVRDQRDSMRKNVHQTLLSKRNKWERERMELEAERDKAREALQVVSAQVRDGKENLQELTKEADSLRELCADGERDAANLPITEKRFAEVQAELADLISQVRTARFPAESRSMATRRHRKGKVSPRR